MSVNPTITVWPTHPCVNTGGRVLLGRIDWLTAALSHSGYDDVASVTGNVLGRPLDQIID
ncbi:hypothetical protein GCM10007298_03850 [Williamsia phyllosphaerae]|uniref:Uncharacterized protein n=1 Tax=Williamsia phyllosphaerae TaxID=885042 RepID=A0ABQ1U830_9NOCA|nr:hypothetical protein GCM10007298_03850 [Williamsia phyllosphaerae]